MTKVIWQQTPEGASKGQTLLQMWFAGVHTDIGGGYAEHDLSDISLTWMIAHTQALLAYDNEYLAKISTSPTAAYGALPPHK